VRRKYKYTQYKQGVYRPVHNEKYIGKHLPQYRSSWELKFFQWCDKTPTVLEWSSESTIVPYISPVDRRGHRYFVDGSIALQEGDEVKRYLVEIKPSQQTKPPVESKRKKKSTMIYEKITYAVNQAKWEAARKFANKRDMSFIILTENELNIK
jgi:hypothetical protein